VEEGVGVGVVPGVVGVGGLDGVGVKGLRNSLELNFEREWSYVLVRGFLWLLEVVAVIRAREEDRSAASSGLGVRRAHGRWNFPQWQGDKGLTMQEHELFAMCQTEGVLATVAIGGASLRRLGLD
jgi:hypothetical protein